MLEKKGMIYDPIAWHQISDEYCPNAQNTPESLSVLSDNMGALDLVMIQGFKPWAINRSEDQAVVSAAWVGLQSKQRRKDNKQTNKQGGLREQYVTNLKNKFV
jgi:hypothetical protein